jgi:threonine dehydratase
LIEHGHDFQAAREHAGALAEEHGLTMLGPFHRDLVTGVATYARELYGAAGELDAVYVPVGQGSGICGLIGVRDLLGLHTEIIGVVAEAAPATKLSFEAGHVVSTETAATFIDGVACRVPEEEAIEIILKGAERIIAVSDDACAEAIRTLLTTTHNLAEPAGAVALAGLLSERDRQRGRTVAVIQTGGNLDSSLLAQILAGHTPSP